MTQRLTTITCRNLQRHGVHSPTPSTICTGRNDDAPLQDALLPAADRAELDALLDTYEGTVQGDYEQDAQDEAWDAYTTRAAELDACLRRGCTAPLSGRVWCEVHELR